MIILSVLYFKDGESVEKFMEADEALIDVFGDNVQRHGKVLISDHSDRGIFPEEDDSVEITEEEMNELFSSDG